MFEINLVPDVKAEMIAAQKKRNVVFFASVAVAAIAAGLVIVLFTIKLGLDAKISSQEDQADLMSKTIKKYDGLSELLTVRKQLSDLSIIGENKKLFSRVFTILHSMVNSTSNGDTVNISRIDVDLNLSTLNFEGQANAGPNTDDSDFRVMESFKKTIEATKYDYGRYVDKYGKEIPTMCIIESNESGVPFMDENKNIYAVWAKGVKSCDPSKDSDASSGESSGSGSHSSMSIENVDRSGDCKDDDSSDLVCIYRTPLFKKWYNDNEAISKMTADGHISGVPHFESSCITYNRDGNTGRWNSENTCNLTASDGLIVSNSVNGRQNSGELVLIFNASLTVDPQVFLFKNKHLLTILPSGKQNVTDSYVQVGDMFVERAESEKTGE